MPLGHSIKLLFHQIRRGGLPRLSNLVYNRFWPARPGMTPAALAAVQDRVGLEIGGPSRVFFAGKVLPVYPHAQCIDNVNFSARTAWEEGTAKRVEKLIEYSLEEMGCATSR